RKGGFGTPVVASILLFILYYMLSISGEKFVRQGVMPAYVGMWLSSFVLGPLGIFLTYKATTDSVILSTEAYTTFFKKIFSRFTKKNA
ncbi:MAG: LptF/LptG family permease, partial [Bacteroidota bacterium]|nr:LptF/LptG family permease [Bacteroidota bacterium]